MLCVLCVLCPPGIDDLLQTVLWVAEEKSLMANPSKLAAGTVIEAHLDKKRGPVATMLVQVWGPRACLADRRTGSTSGRTGCWTELVVSHANSVAA